MTYIDSIINNPIINQMPSIYGIMDLNSTFLFLNPSALKISGFKSNDSLIGCSYLNMPCKASEQYKEFMSQDILVRDTRRPVKILGYYCYDNNEWKILLGEKYLLRDKSNSVIGIASQFTDITHYNIANKLFSIGISAPKLSTKADQPSFILEDNYPGLQLSKRQSECLFYLIRGKTSKETARLLQLSHRTIENYLNEIKMKLNCNTKSELIEKAIHQGFLNIIPHNLLQQ